MDFANFLEFLGINPKNVYCVSILIGDGYMPLKTQPILRMAQSKYFGIKMYCALAGCI